MENYISFVRNQLCNIYVFIDDDTAGNQLIERMKGNATIKDTEYIILKMNGLRNSEIENIFNSNLYASTIAQKYDIPENTIVTSCSVDKKWTACMSDVFRHCGKLWNDDTAKELKTLISETVKASPTLQLLEHRKETFEAGCTHLIEYFSR